MKRRLLLPAALCALLLLLPGVLGALTHEDTDPDPGSESSTRYITDEQGRALFLHGFNTSGSAKDDPDRLPWITEEDVRTEYDLMGTNFVRLLVQWQALEPERGTYDEDYLDAVAERVDWYADLGYHVLIDMHQDLYGRYTSPSEHSGNGAPEWATHNDGLRVESQEQWELVYLEPGVMRSFDHFWNTTGEHPGLMDDYADAWHHVADRFADQPAVLGYDLMNEPFGGSLQGAEFEAGPLAELYRRSMERIREADQDTWIFVEGQAVGVNWGFPSALPHLDDPRDGEPRIVYAPHVYPLPMDLGQTYDEGVTREVVNASIDVWSDSVRTTAERLEAPIVLGEFGLDMSGPGAEEYVERMLRETESMSSGRAYWSNDHDGWGPWADEDLTPGPLADVMDHPYPRAVAGQPQRIHYEEGRKTLHVSWVERAGVDGPTEVYLPAGAVPDEDGFDLRTDAEWDTDWDEDLRILSVEIRGADPGDRHELTIGPDTG